MGVIALLDSTVTLTLTPESPQVGLSFPVDEDTACLDITLAGRLTLMDESAMPVDDWFAHYTRHPDVTPQQRSLLRPVFMDRLRKEASWIVATLVDSRKRCRGYWYLREEHQLFIGESRASECLAEGPLPPGEWQILLQSTPFATVHLEISGNVDSHTTEPSRPVPLPLMTFDDDAPHSEEEDALWMVGELFECCDTLMESRSAEHRLQAADALQYQFLCLADRFRPPIRQLNHTPKAIPIRGALLKTTSHSFLLPGIRRMPETLRTSADPDPEVLTRETHEQGGLVVCTHPFGLHAAVRNTNPTPDDPLWDRVDALLVWPGVWEERFPEVLQTLALWDELLNRGRRTVGLCGKGPDWPLDETQVERLPKTLALCRGSSETAILNAVVQGHTYMTVEPAIRLWVDSDGGSMQMGGELRLPLGATYHLRIHVSLMDRSGFFIVRTNTGIFCHMPLSSVRDSDLSFVAQASQQRTWYRMEVYQYGRPLDRLMALSNPVFVRGLISL